MPRLTQKLIDSGYNRKLWIEELKQAAYSSV